METWLKLYRKFTEWEWYSDINCRLVFMHLLLTVNWQAKKWQGKVIGIGQTITSLVGLASEVGISVQQLRTVLKKLSASGEVEIKAFSNHTLITLNKFSKYQQTNNTVQNQVAQGLEVNGDLPINKRATKEQQTSNKRATTPIELKKDRNIELYNTDGGDYIYNINNIYSESAPPPADTEVGKVFSVYQQNIGVLSPIAVNILKDRITAQGAALVSLAIVEAVKNNAKSIRYIEKILDAWESDNIKTVEDAKLRISERRHKQDNSGKLPSNVEKSTFRNYPEDPNKVSEVEKQMIDKMMRSYG